MTDMKEKDFAIDRAKEDHKEVHWEDEDNFATPASTVAVLGSPQSPQSSLQSNRRNSTGPLLLTAKTPGDVVTKEWKARPSPLDSELRYYEQEAVLTSCKRSVTPRFIEFSSASNDNDDVKEVCPKDIIKEPGLCVTAAPGKESSPGAFKRKTNDADPHGDMARATVKESESHPTNLLEGPLLFPGFQEVWKNIKQVETIRSLIGIGEKIVMSCQCWVQETATAAALKSIDTSAWKTPDGAFNSCAMIEKFCGTKRELVLDFLQRAKVAALPHARLLQGIVACLIAAMAFCGFEILVLTMSDFLRVPPFLVGTFVTFLLVLDFILLEDVNVKVLKTQSSNSENMKQHGDRLRL